jgi:aryl-alcohol dehydrogenase-like predicted oxidoreductase
MVQCAEQAGGASHRFRWIQLPLNLAMTEALSNGVLSAAADAGITVISSASILQSRLAKNLPDQLSTLAPHGTDAQRAIQFSRSAPGISVSLVGMSNVEHVRENLGITRFAPMQPGDFEKLFA